MVEYDPNVPGTPAFAERWHEFPAGVHTRLWAGLAHFPEFLAEVRRHPHEALAVDIETVGKGADSYKVKVVALATTAVAIALDPRDPRQLSAIREVLDVAKVIVFHNSPFDVPPLYHLGAVTDSHIEKVWDTLVLARMAEPDTFVDKSLDGLVSRHVLGLNPGQIKEQSRGAAAHEKLRNLSVGAKNRSDYFRLADIHVPGYLIDNITDAMATARLFHIMRRAAVHRLTENHPFGVYGVRGDDADRLLHREAVVNRMMLRRTARGLRVDTEFLDQYREKFQAGLDADAAVLQAEGIDPGNGNHLTAWLDERGLLPSKYPRTPKTGKPSATAANLEKLEHPLAQRFIRWKEQTKVGGYLEKVADMAAITGKCHPQVNVLGASATGRMSVSNPPLQQFPGDARGILIADEGGAMTSIDWTSVEPYVIACLAKDLGLAEFYEGGGDIYEPIMRKAGIDRKTAKTVVLAQLYGQGVAALSAKLGMNQEDGRALRDAVLSAMPGVAAFSQQIKTTAERYGVITTVSGRILPIPVFEGRYAAYIGVNYVVQGSAYDVLAESLLRVHEAGLDEAVYLAMHDELVVDTAAADDVRRIMETAPAALEKWAGRPVRLRTDRADLGLRWAAA